MERKQLVIDGGAVYEMDERCIAEKKLKKDKKEKQEEKGQAVQGQ